MKKRQYEESIEILKSFEKKDHTLKAMAATNLSFIYFLEEDYKQAYCPPYCPPYCLHTSGHTLVILDVNML